MKHQWGKITAKLYKCCGCGHEEKLETNHFHECYPECSVCHSEGRWGPQVWFCLEPKEQEPVLRLEYLIRRERLKR